jgi:hypothetical protein
MYEREQRRKGQLTLDYQDLNRKLNKLRPLLSSAEERRFNRCVQDISAAFGAILIHARHEYPDQLDVPRGWQKFWRDLDNALKGASQYISTLPVEDENPGRSGGSTGPRTDTFFTDRGCA